MTLVVRVESDGVNVNGGRKTSKVLAVHAWLILMAWMMVVS